MQKSKAQPLLELAHMMMKQAKILREIGESKLAKSLAERASVLREFGDLQMGPQPVPVKIDRQNRRF